MKGGAILPSPLYESFSLLGFDAFSMDEWESAVKKFEADESVMLIVVLKEREKETIEKLKNRMVIGI